MEKEKKLAQNTLTYMIANFGAKILILIIYPVYTYYIVPDDLGIYDLIISTLTLIYPIVVFSINDAVFRWLLDYDSGTNNEVIAVGLKVTFRNLFIVDIVYIIVNLSMKIQYGWYILLIANFGAIYPVFQQITRGLKKNKIFAISGLVYAIALVLFNLILVVWLDFYVDGLLLSQAFAYFIACVFLFFFVPELKIRWWKIEVSKNTMDNMTKYSLMLIPNSCCWWIMNASDRYMIRFFIGNAANGIYAISHKFPSVMNMFTSVFTLAWQEQAIVEYSSDDRDEFYSKIYEMYYIALFSVCMILLPITKWFVILFIQSDYLSAWKYCSALYLGSVFQALASFLGTGYLSVKDTRGSMTTSLIGAIINILINLMLLPVIGLEAASISTLISNIGIWFARWIKMKKYFTLRVKWSKFIIFVISSLIIGVVIRFTNIFIDCGLFIFLFIITFYINKDIIDLIIKKLISMIKIRIG